MTYCGSVTAMPDTTRCTSSSRELNYPPARPSTLFSLARELSFQQVKLLTLLSLLGKKILTLCVTYTIYGKAGLGRMTRPAPGFTLLITLTSTKPDCYAGAKRQAKMSEPKPKKPSMPTWQPRLRAVMSKTVMMCWPHSRRPAWKSTGPGETIYPSATLKATKSYD